MAQAEVKQNSAVIASKILAMPEYRAATRLYTYLGARNEVDTTSIVLDALQQGKRVYAPRIEGGAMHWGRIASFEELVTGAFGILEPPRASKQPAESQANDLCLVPGVLFQDDGHRLGQGGGHYDRFLSTFNGIRLGLAHEWQLVDSLPIEPHDIPMQIIQTEQRALRTASAPK